MQNEPITSKISQGVQLLQRNNGPTRTGSLRVLVTSVAEFDDWLRATLPKANILQRQGSILTLGNLPPKSAKLFAEQPFVSFVDVGPRVPTEELIIKSSDMTVNAIAAAQAAFPQATGAGMVLSIKEQPFDTSDIDLAGRILYNSVFAQASVLHATTMATLAAGAGNSGPFSKGVAPRATLTTASFANLMPDALDTLRRLGVTAQNHSYGVGLENFYGIESAAYDDQCRRAPYLLHTFSAGNAGRQTPTVGPYSGVTGVANLTGQFKLSKNTLSVGEISANGVVQSISSRGPAYDGRVKPEIVAFGSGGTSEAAALVSGAAVLLQQRFRNANNGSLPPSALVKAILISSATDVGRPAVDFETGFGALNVLGALQTLAQNRFWVDSLAATQTRSFNITVPAGATLLKVTLVWNDPAAAPGAATALVNNLDLELRDPMQQTWLPWVLSTAPDIDSLRWPATRRRDRLNNVEQVTLAAPAAGTYVVRVTGTTVSGTQPFAIAYEVQSGLQQFTYPVKGLRLDTLTTMTVRWQGSPAGTSRLEYRVLPSGPWQLITDTLAATTRQYNWKPPATTSIIQMRLSSGAQSILSDTIGVFPAPNVTIGYNCPSQVLLIWNRIAGATGYRVNALSGPQLAPIANTADTIWVINKTTSASVNYSVTPIIPGVLTSPGFTVNYNTQGVGCYIRQFTPVAPTTDATPQLQIALGSTFGVQGMELLKLSNGAFQRIQTFSTNTGTFTYNDPDPQPAANTYRLRLSTSTVGIVLSDTVTVLYSGAGQSYLFPNPVRPGQPLQLISGPSNTAQIQIFDIQGRRVYNATEQGAIKQIATRGLVPGLYMVMVIDGDGRRSVRRLVVQ